MRNVLNQSEIDTLLKSLEQGEVTSEELIKEQPKVKKYDFRRPNRFSKNNLSTLSSVHDNFARQVANFLSAYLRATVNAKLATVDQVAFEDLLVSLPASTLVTIFSMGEFGPALINAGSDIVIPIIDLICGGTGEQVRKLRVVTELEMAMYQRLCTHLLDRYEAAWRDTATFQCRLDSLESNPRLIQVVPPHEMVAVVTLTLTINKVHGILTVCLPFTTINLLVNRPEVRAVSPEGFSIQQQWHDRQRFFSTAELGVTAVLGGCDITVEDFLQLQVGDCLAINTKPGEALSVFVEGKRVFLAQPGLSGDQAAVQIISSLTEGDEKF